MKFKKHLDKVEAFDFKKNKLASRIKSIYRYKRIKSDRVIILAKVQKLYLQKCNRVIGISTFVE